MTLRLRSRSHQWFYD